MDITKRDVDFKPQADQVQAATALRIRISRERLGQSVASMPRQTQPTVFPSAKTDLMRNIFEFS